MLIKCPRCGFSQPKDEYCASCGINIEKYVPQKKSLSKSIGSSMLFQALIIVIASVAASYFFINQSKNSSKNNFNTYSSINNSTNADSTPTALPGQVDSANQDANTVSIEQPSETQAAMIAGGTAAQTESLANTNMANGQVEAMSAPSSARSDAKMEQAKNEMSFKISYYEVDVRLIEQWIQASQGQRTDAFKTGSIKSTFFNQSIKQPALKSETISQDINSPKEVQFGYRQPNSNFQGHIIKSVIDKKENSTLYGSIQISKSANELIQTQFVLQKDFLFFIYWQNGLTGLTQDNMLSSHPPFQIIESNQFLSHTTDLIIVLEPTF